MHEQTRCPLSRGRLFAVDAGSERREPLSDEVLYALPAGDFEEAQPEREPNKSLVPAFLQPFSRFA